ASVALLPEHLRNRLQIVQQARAEDIDSVTKSYRQSRTNVQLASFFSDLPEQIAASHLVIGRSGASTIAELTVIGRPAILIPLPGWVDGDQESSAVGREEGGGGWVAERAALSPQSLATRLEELFANPATLKRAAEAARKLGQPQAVERLSDLAEMLAGKHTNI